MISALHLLWIVPLCVMAGVFLTEVISCLRYKYKSLAPKTLTISA